jgi:hypothetical protein
MFIREKTKTVKGKKYVQHQLIESIRTPAGPRQRLVLNLGFLDLQRDKWKELANTIESEIREALATNDFEQAHSLIHNLNPSSTKLWLKSVKLA